jgi:hypothetical protein
LTRIDPSVVSLAELRARGRQAAEAPEQWKAGVKEHRPLAASPAAISLAMLMTGEELDSQETMAGVGEIERRGRSVDQMLQALIRLRAMVSLPKYSPPMPPPTTGDRGWTA